MSTTTPRPTLYAARHEDSALFSVAEVLRAAAGAAARGRSDSSGFVDVRDLRAPEPGLPGSLRAAPPRPAPRRPGRAAGLQGVVATLAVALLGSLTAIAAPFSAQAHDRDEAAEAAMYGHWEHGDDFDGDVLLIPDERPEAPAPAPAAAGAEAEDDAPAPAPTATARTKARARAKAKAPAASEAPAKAPAKAKAPVVDAGPDPTSVECLLDPARCKRPQRADARPAAAAPEPAAGLPDKLDAAALKAGVGAARDAARSGCARLAGDLDKIQVRLSILGESGEVVSAHAQGDAAGTAAGACVEEALQDARFDRFQAARQGLVVTVRF